MSTGTTPKSVDDRAALAYAAIKSQLAEWGGFDASSSDTELFIDDNDMMLDDFPITKRSNHSSSPRLLSSSYSTAVFDESQLPVAVAKTTASTFREAREEKEETPEQYSPDYELESPLESSLDGDYRRYHDALHSLLRTVQEQRNYQGSSATRNILLTSLMEFLKQLSATCYVRSSLLYSSSSTPDDFNGIRTSIHQSDAALEYGTETEGHFWDLLHRLCKNSSKPMEFLLWDASKDDFFDQQRQLLHSWITTFVQKLSKLDPATLAHAFLTDCIYHSTDHIQLQQETIPPIPPLVHRRQVILDWIEACQSRNIVSHKTLEQVTISWKDTANFFKQSTNSRQATARTDKTLQGKCTNMDPDEPLRISLRDSNQAKSASASTSIQPLYGNDNAQEVYVLSTCLSLLKAGRFETDALHLCRSSFGQPWRAAVWAGDLPYGNNDKGNPQRPLWKRIMWANSLRMHEALGLHRSDTNSTSALLTSGTLVYEAAIASVLADNVEVALQNPKVNKMYTDTLWLLFRCMQKRILEEVYHAHNNARRKFDLAQDYPPVGSEYLKEEREQLTCTQPVANMNENEILLRLEKLYGEHSDTTSQDHKWNQALGAFVHGLYPMKQYLLQATTWIVHQMPSRRNPGSEAFLRFMTHLVLFLDIIADESLFIKETESMRKVNMTSMKNELLCAYVQNLISQRCLWHLVALYSSLLPLDDLMNTSTTFWVKFVLEERDRKMVLHQAREYFAPGIDLLILRRVVRKSLESTQLITMGSSDSTDLQSLKPMVTSFVRLLPPRQGCKVMGNSSKVMDDSISKVNVQKMQSLEWLSSYPEHYPDAVICSNMLLRKFLLESNLDNDGLEDLSLYSAKVFISRFLPQDLVDVTLAVVQHPNYLNDVLYAIEPVLIYQEIDNFRAIHSYLEAHSNYVIWRRTLSTASPRVRLEKKFFMPSVEGEISSKMEKKTYVMKKKEVILSIVKVAEAARQALMRTLIWDDGWLWSDDSFIEEERQAATQEYRSLQIKFIPHCVELVYKVLSETAIWINQFIDDIEQTFGRDNRSELLYKICSETAEETENPFLPETWHRMALNLAIDVASDKNRIMESMKRTELDTFLNRMADSAAALLLCEERNK